LKYQRSIFRKTQSSLAFHEQRSRELRYVWAVTLVALGLLTGFILQPAFGRSQAYATFYPVVLLAAYTLGPKPAAVTAILSAAVAYWCFVPPDFQWKWDTQVGAALVFFLATSAVAIWLISRLMRSTAGRAERSVADLARVNAVIFAELGANGYAARTPASALLTTRPVARHAAQPSERSFGGVRADRDADEPVPAAPDRSSARRAEDAPAGERGATLH
jgi:K+-sensing histidine kinase KdpD